MPPVEDSRHTLYCSFCGKSQNEVKKLIAGPTVYICNECVMLCLDIVIEKIPPESVAEEFARLHSNDDENIAKLKELIEKEIKRHAPYVPVLEAYARFLREREET